MMRLIPLPPAAWPADDRAALDLAFAKKESLFSDAGRGSHLALKTRTLYRRGYGIWLAFLADSCGFRRKAAGDSDGRWPLIPIEGGHRFRRNPATHRPG